MSVVECRPAPAARPSRGPAAMFASDEPIPGEDAAEPWPRLGVRSGRTDSCPGGCVECSPWASAPRVRPGRTNYGSARSVAYARVALRLMRSAGANDSHRCHLAPALVWDGAAFVRSARTGGQGDGLRAGRQALGGRGWRHVRRSADGDQGGRGPSGRGPGGRVALSGSGPGPSARGTRAASRGPVGPGDRHRPAAPPRRSPVARPARRAVRAPPRTRR